MSPNPLDFFIYNFFIFTNNHSFDSKFERLKKFLTTYTTFNDKDTSSFLIIHKILADFFQAKRMKSNFI